MKDKGKSDTTPNAKGFDFATTEEFIEYQFKNLKEKPPLSTQSSLSVKHTIKGENALLVIAKIEGVEKLIHKVSKVSASLRVVVESSPDFASIAILKFHQGRADRDGWTSSSTLS